LIRLRRGFGETGLADNQAGPADQGSGIRTGIVDIASGFHRRSIDASAVQCARRPVIRSSLFVLLLALSSACRSSSAPPDMTLDFRGLWPDVRSQSAATLPSRETELTTWSTGKDQPHPDVVNAQVLINVASDSRRRAMVLTLREEWRIGTREGGEDSATWSERSQRMSPPLDLVPGKAMSLSLPVAVGDMVRRQTRAGRVPWRLAVRAELRDASSAQPIATAQATLPIAVN
jgi:hypothetical protein